MGDVPRLLEKYRGREEVMIASLENKYKTTFHIVGEKNTSLHTVTPVTPGLQHRLVKFYQQHDQSKISSIPHILNKYRGNEDKMVRILQSKYNAWFPAAEGKLFLIYMCNFHV